jgi:hypothetical protein
MLWQYALRKSVFNGDAVQYAPNLNGRAFAAEMAVIEKVQGARCRQAT